MIVGGLGRCGAALRRSGSVPFLACSGTYSRGACLLPRRKNYLFVGNARAGERLAGLYSLVGSCIANGIEPTEYLTDVLARAQRATTDDELDALLPDRWSPA